MAGKRGTGDNFFRDIPEDSNVTAQVVASPFIRTSDGNWTGRILAAVTGTYYQGASVESSDGFFFKANPANTGTIWLGYTDTTSAMFPLAAGDPIPVMVKNLNEVWILGTVANEDVRWIRI